MISPMLGTLVGLIKQLYQTTRIPNLHSTSAESTIKLSPHEGVTIRNALSSNKARKADG
jgi:hypothetical protein